jgi:regulator of sigma E protease
MGNFLFSLLAFIVAISVLVAIHEYGHYIVGRWAGMKVLRYSIGFGRPIWKRVSGPDQTEYCVSMIPLGGYVRFLDSREGPVAPEDEGRAFDQRPIWQRIVVLFAGPLFNFVFAVIVYWALFIYGVTSYVAAVGTVEAGSVADAAGLQNGDRIVAVGDIETGNWESALVAMIENLVSSGRVPLTLEDAGGARRETMLEVGDNSSQLTEPGALWDGLGFRPWTLYDAEAVIGVVGPDGTAAEAGLLEGDRITAVDGIAIADFGDLVEAVSTRPGTNIPVEFERGGRIITIDVDVGAVDIQGKTVGRIGVGPAAVSSDFRYLQKYGPLEAIGPSLQNTWSKMVFTVNMLGRMLTGDVSIKNISGPINIARFAGESAERGLDRYIDFLAIISISLGILNLLPVPVLDGGQIMYQLAEAVKGGPLSERAQIIGQQVGILALLILMSFAFYNDIVGIFG